MSDCSTLTMKPKKRRTCGTCKHVNDVRLGCMFAANDSSYYMRCTKPDARACEHHVDDPDSLPSDTDAFREQLEGCGVSVDA